MGSGQRAKKRGGDNRRGHWEFSCSSASPSSSEISNVVLIGVLKSMALGIYNTELLFYNIGEDFGEPKELKKSSKYKLVNFLDEKQRFTFAIFLSKGRP